MEKASEYSLASAPGLHFMPRPTQQPLAILRRRIALFQWLAPAVKVIFVLLYEILPGRFIHSRFGTSYHILAEILVLGTLGPSLTFFLILFIRRWLEERETSDLQAELLGNAREQIKISQAATDDALQALLAASVFLLALENRKDGCTEEEAHAIHQTQEVFGASIKKMRDYLETKFF